jgi:DNA mismatch repair protein MutL
MPIRILPVEVAGRIAAGEVVERPASVVKELVENALDAGARRVAVEIEAGGLGLIRVVDDGCGIAAEELVLAFQRHATSKLPGDDLDAVATLGFRGEALPSIAAVAEVEAVSRTEGSDGAAFVRLCDGELLESGPAGAAPGTSISVRGLFRRLPARLKFLRSPASEAGQVATVVSHYALAYPEVAFSLRMDGRLSFETAGSGSRREAAAGVYGAGAAASLIEVSDLLPESGRGIEALVSPPSFTRSSRSHITLFVNRRWVRSRSLAYAVEEAYRGLLPSGRFPVAIVDIRVPPSEVDVNVHPAKAEVRLRDDREVFGLVQRPIRRALAGQAPASMGSDLAWARPSAPPVGAWPERPAPVALPSEEPVTEAAAGSQSGLSLRVPVLRPLGQAGTTYVIAEGPAGLFLIDQHAAHERVMFEKIRAGQAGGEVTAQGLLAPVVLELTPAHQEVLASFGEELRQAGFAVEPFGPDGRGFLLRSLPALIDTRGDPAVAVTAYLELMLREDGPRDPWDRVAASLACHAAVRAGQTLSDAEMRDLLRQLEECETPQTCPHGRPTMLHLSVDELARRFGRR